MLGRYFIGGRDTETFCLLSLFLLLLLYFLKNIEIDNDMISNKPQKMVLHNLSRNEIFAKLEHTVYVLFVLRASELIIPFLLLISIQMYYLYFIYVENHYLSNKP